MMNVRWNDSERRRLGGNISQCHFTHHGDWPGLRSVPQIWAASDVLQYCLMTPYLPVLIFYLLLLFPVRFEYNFFEYTEAVRQEYAMLVRHLKKNVKGFGSFDLCFRRRDVSALNHTLH